MVACRGAGVACIDAWLEFFMWHSNLRIKAFKAPPRGAKY